MNIINRISATQTELKLTNRPVISVSNTNLSLSYNVGTNICAIEVFKVFQQELKDGLTVNGVVITDQQSFDAAQVFLYSQTENIQTFTSNTLAIAAGLTNGQKYYLPIANDNYILCYVVNNSAPVVPVSTAGSLLNENGLPIYNENGQPILY